MAQFIYTMNRVGKVVPPKRVILRDISLSFFPGAKIGVLGLNGSGKSTLLKIMAGLDKEIEGEARPQPGIKIGYLQQEPQLDASKDVRGNVLEGVAEIQSLLDRFNAVSDKFADPDLSEDAMNKLMEEQAKLQDAIDANGGWELERKLEVAGDALRLPPWDADVSKISGGEKRRVALCRLLLSQPDMLLLDEPTNHLDAESVAWLEHFLETYPGTVIAVTHDRYFLDNVAGWILELDRGHGIPWEGNYSSWLEQKEKRLATEEKQQEGLRKTLAKELEWVRQNPKARQANPRIAFINKCDRTGANPLKVASDLREKLGLNPVLLQLPIGLETQFNGLVDLITMKAVYFEGSNGENIIIKEIPEEMAAKAAEAHEKMLDGLSMFSEELTEAMLEGKVTAPLINKAMREATLAFKCCPVMMGSAYKNKGVQLLLDGVINFLPSPLETTQKGHDLDNDDAEVPLFADDSKPTVALAFKLEEGQFGQLTHIRVYQGAVRKGSELRNTRTGKIIRVGRLVRMHADEMEEITSAGSGELTALFGVDCASGDTFTDPSLNIHMTKMHVPDPVISLSVTVPDSKSETQLSKALNRFTKEDPTFHAYVDPESSQTIIKGMGELHLDVYVERIRREYGVQVTTGAPEVAFREAITRKLEFTYVHRKQTGGSGQFAKIEGWFEPCEEQDFLFESEVKGGSIPTEYIPAIEKGFLNSVKKGKLIGFPVVRFKVVVNDGASHAVDSSDMAFQVCAQNAFNEYYLKAAPCILEPIMKVSVEGPCEFQGAMLSTLNQRRGIILFASDDGIFSRVDAEVPLSEMFGYSTVIRSATQGKAEFTMEFLKYAKVPSQKSETMIKEYAEKRAKGNK